MVISHDGYTARELIKAFISLRGHMGDDNTGIGLRYMPATLIFGTYNPAARFSQYCGPRCGSIAIPLLHCLTGGLLLFQVF